ncbi:MAG TPA: hypothetical protein VGW33_01915 [Terriglobia bacterium]|nr:hypothetical protein [Terriglobia bacterium]
MPDYNFLMESRLAPEQLAVVNQLSRIAAVQGMNLYLAGGAVRDLTAGVAAVRDLDFVIEGNVQKIVRPLVSGSHPRPRHADPLAAANPETPVEVTHFRFDPRLQSAQLAFAGGSRAEISMSRSETYRAPGRRPEIAPAMIFDDLKRRDFSLNAMAISLHPNSRGLLLDPTNGTSDIERREIRALHSRSFMEDPSRIYRLLRLGHRLGFSPDERTERWLNSALAERAWESVDPAVQGSELRAILQEENPGRILKMLKERGLLGGLDRKLGAARLDYERFDKIRSAARSAPGADTYLLNFLCLVEKLPGGDRNRLAKKILENGKAIRFTLGLDREAQKLAHTLSGPKAAQPSQVYAVLSDVPQPLLLFLLAHASQAKVQNRLKSFLVKFPAVRAKLPRAELQAMGMEPGPKFEKVMEQVFLDELDGKIKGHQQMTKALREYSGIKPPPPPPEPPPARRTKKVEKAKATVPPEPVVKLAAHEAAKGKAKPHPGPHPGPHPAPPLAISKPAPAAKEPKALPAAKGAAAAKAKKTAASAKAAHRAVHQAVQKAKTAAQVKKGPAKPKPRKTPARQSPVRRSAKGARPVKSAKPAKPAKKAAKGRARKPR